MTMESQIPMTTTIASSMTKVTINTGWVSSSGMGGGGGGWQGEASPQRILL